VKLLRAFDRYWFDQAPAARIGFLRVLVGAFAVVYLVARTPYLLSYATFNPAQFDAMGPVSVIDSPLLPWLWQGIVFATIALSVAFVLGWKHRITGPLFAVACLWTLSYRNSWGMIFHTENLLVLQVLVLGFTASADAYSLDARPRDTEPDPSDGRYGWPLRLMCLLTVIAYVLAGIAKLRFGGTDWTGGEVLRNYIASDNLRKLLLGSTYSPLAIPLLERPWVFTGFAWMTIAFELGAPIALFGRRLAWGWVAIAWGFHAGVLGLMAILFPYPLFLIGFACFFRTERLGAWCEGKWARWRPKRAAGSG
jgi:hypothetical protein